MDKDEMERLLRRAAKDVEGKTVEEQVEEYARVLDHLGVPPLTKEELLARFKGHYE